VNGVVRTLNKTVETLRSWGHEVLVVHPGEFRTIPLPTYPDIRLAIAPKRKLRRMLDAFSPEAVHIATEGTLGWAAKAYCQRAGLRYTTAYHTKFPEYVRLRVPIPLSVSYAVVRRFHDPAVRTMVATPTIEKELKARGFKHIARWSRGVDVELFKPDYPKLIEHDGPVCMFVGRVAVEKNIEAFLKLELPGLKVVIGGGPALEELKARYPDVRFLGEMDHPQVAKHLTSADVFVFPSLTDTFGLVMLEANGAGVPVAAFPVAGPVDVVVPGVNGYLDEDLSVAIEKALTISRESCREHALENSWDACTRQFLENLHLN
ncbi:MAG: glycosyltransferase family 4 protein, partial [Gammaproteobacteria bacterium]